MSEPIEAGESILRGDLVYVRHGKAYRWPHRPPTFEEQVERMRKQGITVVLPPSPNPSTEPAK